MEQLTEDLGKAIQRVLEERATQNIVLSISSRKKGIIDRDWEVDINMAIESDL